MTVKELQEHKGRIEASLGEEIGKQLILFFQETEVDITSVFVNMVDVRTFGGEGQKYVLGSVRCELAI